MPYRVTQFEPTPNPNALKCWLDKAISEGPRSFLNADMAGEDPVAKALFEKAGANCVLMNGDWITVNKPANLKWNIVKKAIQEILDAAEG